MYISELEPMLKDYFASMYNGGDFLAWLEEESKNPLGMSFNNEAKLLLKHYQQVFIVAQMDTKLQARLRSAYEKDDIHDYYASFEFWCVDSIIAQDIIFLYETRKEK